MENKYREFWLEFDRGRWTATYTEKVDGLNEDAIHVIEYAALESANAEIATLKERERLMWNQASIQEKALVALELENKKLSDENARLRAALEEINTGVMSMYLNKGHMIDSFKKVAREALEKLK